MGRLDLNEYLDGRVDFIKDARFGWLGYDAACDRAGRAMRTTHCKDWRKVYDTTFAETKKAYAARFASGEMPLRRALLDARARRAVLLPYRIDLTALGEYGCDTDYVRGLERLAVSKAEPVVQALLARVRSDGQSIILYHRDKHRDVRTWGRVAFRLPGSELYTL